MAKQLTRDDLKTMTPEAIVDANAGGQLNDLLGIPAEETALLRRAREGRIDITDVRDLAQLGHHDLIATAGAEGRVDA